jgi:hypothetical protein
MESSRCGQVGNISGAQAAQRGAQMGHVSNPAGAECQTRSSPVALHRMLAARNADLNTRHELE